MNNYRIDKPEQEWPGLSLDQIRYARALTRARIEIGRELCATQAASLFKGTDATTGGRTLLGRMLGALNWIDYGLIALRVGSKAAHIFRKRK